MLGSAAHEKWEERMSKKRIGIGLAVLLVAAVAGAQVATSNTFTDGDVISAAEMNQNFDELVAAINYHHPASQGTWIAPTLINGWQDYGADYNATEYFRDSNGIVHLRGLVKNGTLGLTVFTLPVGYRPVARELHVCNSAGAFGRVDVFANGDVIIQTGGPGWVALDGITFMAVDF
jgi:hypothetical protein